MLDEVQSIDCKCGMWEEFGADEPRDHSQSFTWVENFDDGTARYECPTCHSLVRSQIFPREEGR